MSTTNGTEAQGAEAQGAGDATIQVLVQMMQQMQKQGDFLQQQMVERDKREEWHRQKRLDAQHELEKQRSAEKAADRELKELELSYKNKLLALDEKKLAHQEEQAKQLHEALAQNKEALAKNTKLAAALQEVLSGGWPGPHHQLQDAGASGTAPHQRVLTNGTGHQDSRRGRAAEPTVPPDAAGHDASAAARASGPARAPVLPSAQTGARSTDAAAPMSATHELWPIRAADPADPVMNATVAKILEDHEAFNNGSSDEEMEDPDLEDALTAQLEQLVLANTNNPEPPVSGARTYVLSRRTSP